MTEQSQTSFGKVSRRTVAAISERMRTPRGRFVLLGLGIVLFVAATVLLLTFPKLV